MTATTSRSQAAALCAGRGYTLCADACAGSGCGYDSGLVWTSLPCAPRSPASIGAATRCGRALAHNNNKRADGEGCDYSFVDLSGADLRDGRFRHASFIGADLSGTYYVRTYTYLRLPAYSLSRIRRRHVYRSNHELT